MEDLTRLSVDEFLNQTAARTPTPGGGAVAALAASLACAQARMVAAYSIYKATSHEDRAAIDRLGEQLYRADLLLRAMISRDAAAYEAMTAAAKAARAAGAGDASTKAAHQKAVLDAAGVPVQIAALAANVLAILDAFKALSNRHLVSDLGIAAVLAESAARCARWTIAVNAPQIDDQALRDKILTEGERTELHCEGRLASIEAYVAARLQESAAPSR